MSVSIPKRHAAWRAAIRAAAMYTGFARSWDVYVDLECGTGVSAYTLAIADWFGAPKVLEINVDGWTGQIGQTIRVKARDDIMVAAVAVVIRDPQRNFLEMGEAVQSEAGSRWWNYRTQTRVNLSPFPPWQPFPRSGTFGIQDLPGNRDAFVISLAGEHGTKNNTQRLALPKVGGFLPSYRLHS